MPAFSPFRRAFVVSCGLFLPLVLLAASTPPQEPLVFTNLANQTILATVVTSTPTTVTFQPATPPEAAPLTVPLAAYSPLDRRRIAALGGTLLISPDLRRAHAAHLAELDRARRRLALGLVTEADYGAFVARSTGAWRTYLAALSPPLLPEELALLLGE